MPFPLLRSCDLDLEDDDAEDDLLAEVPFLLFLDLELLLLRLDLELLLLLDREELLEDDRDRLRSLERERETGFLSLPLSSPSLLTLVASLLTG